MMSSVSLSRHQRVAFVLSNPSAFMYKRNPIRSDGVSYGGAGGICLHFLLRRK